jgi:hypothetical protein
MKNTKKLKLIDGNFKPQEAREILMNVFSGKIQFHQMKNFSSKERFGKEDKIAVKRIPQLKKCIEKINKIIEQAEKKGGHLAISSDIVISINTF